MKSFFELFPYVIIDDDVIISDSPTMVTTVLEVILSEFDSVETMQCLHDKLIEFFCDLPMGTVISIYYCKIFFPAQAKLIQMSNHDIVNYMERNKYDAVNRRMSPEFSCYISVTFPVPEKDDDGLAAKTAKKQLAKDKDYEQKRKIMRIREVRDALKFKMGGFCSRFGAKLAAQLNRGQILMFLSKILNHEYIFSARDLSDIIRSDWNIFTPGVLDKRHGYVHYNSEFHTVLSLRANTIGSRLPSDTDASMNMVYTSSSDIWDIPFVIQHTIKFPAKADGLKQAMRRASMIANREGFAQYFKFLEKTPEGLPPEKLRLIVEHAIEIVEGTNARFLHQFYHVHLWDKSLPSLDKRYKTFNEVINMTYKLKREKFNIKGAYFSLFPGNEGVEKITHMLPSFNVADFMPIDLPRTPYYDPRNRWEIYYHTELDSFAKIDLFDKRADNHNAIVAGGSGSGKSFSEQDKLWQIMKYDPCIAIIDFGGEGMGSYLSFVKNLKGTYLEINFNTKFSINPFEGPYYVTTIKDAQGREIEESDPNGEPSPLKETSLMTMLSNMIRGKDRGVMLPQIKAALTDCVRQYYDDENNNTDNTCNLSDFAERYLKEHPVFLQNPDWDLYKCIYDFIGEGKTKGRYASFFRETEDVGNNDVICFDLAGLTGHDALKAVLVPTLINMIMTNILGDKTKLDRKKVIIMDEAWRELQGGDMASFMMEMFRTIRKLNGQITIITQSIDDLLGSAISNALMSNTSYYWLIGEKHKPDSLRTLKAGQNELSSYDIDRIITQKSKRDFYLLTPFYKGQLRLYPTKEFAMLATTNPDEKEVLNKYRRQFHVDYTSPEVIEAAKKDPYYA